MLRQDSDRHIIRKRRVRLREAYLDRQRVRAADLRNIRIIGHDLRPVLLVENRLQRKLHVCRSQRFSVMEGEPISKGKGVGTGFFVETPVLRQSRHDLVLFIVRRQPREQQRIDLAMLIQRRIDRGIIAAAVTQHTLSVRTLSLIACAAARQKPCQQQEQQHPRKYLRSCSSHCFHRLFSYSFFLFLISNPSQCQGHSPGIKDCFAGGCCARVRIPPAR